MSVGILVLALTATVTSLIVGRRGPAGGGRGQSQPRWHVCTETFYEAIYRGLVIPVVRRSCREVPQGTRSSISSTGSAGLHLAGQVVVAAIAAPAFPRDGRPGATSGHHLMLRWPVRKNCW